MDESIASDTAASAPVIEATGLTKVYDSLPAVNKIDFRVKCGECFGLLGPNGAGKSTTVKMIYGLSPVTSGSLKVFGYDINTHSRIIKERLGIVAQEDNLDPELTVMENLLVFAGYFKLPSKIARSRAEELLSFMDLEAKANTIVDHLSGGLKRRLTIARALINKPELIILDEPTTGLDPHARHTVWQKIRSLKEQGTTLLLTTHYLEEASQLCDRLVFINDGAIVEEGHPRELVLQHIGKEVLELAGGEFRDLVGQLNSASYNGYQTIGSTSYIYTNDGLALQEQIHRLGINFTYKYLRPATLEDVFLRLTGRTLENSFEGDDPKP